MAKYKPQYAPLLFIDLKIREKRYPNCSLFNEEWEASSKTILRSVNSGHQKTHAASTCS